VGQRAAAGELQSLEGLGFDLALTGFSLDEIRTLEDPRMEAEPARRRTRVAAQRVSEQARSGAWVPIGCCATTRHRWARVRALMAGDLADLLLPIHRTTSPTLERRKQRMKIQTTDEEREPSGASLRQAFTCGRLGAEARRGLLHLGTPTPRATTSRRGVDVGWELRQTLIWNKNSMVFGRQTITGSNEPCSIGLESGASHCGPAKRTQTTVLEFEWPEPQRPAPER